MFPSNDISGGVPQPPQGFEKLRSLGKPKIEDDDIRGAHVVPRDDEKPFLAIDVDDNEMPYYGEGVKGWLRKTYAHIFEPSQMLKERSDAHDDYIADRTEDLAQEWQNDDWKQTTSRWLGVSLEERAEVQATKEAAEMTGAEGQLLEERDTWGRLSTSTGIAVRGFINGAVYGGLELLQTTERLTEKYFAVGQALDEVGDGSFLPDLSNEEAISMFEGTPYEEVASFLVNFNDTLFLPYNALRAITAGKDIEEGKATVGNYLRASQSVFSLMWDEEKKAEYFRRMEAGEPPSMLAAELENPYVEFAAGVFLDPTTYMGVGILGKAGKGGKAWKVFGAPVGKYLGIDVVGRTPSFSKILNLGFGSNKIANSHELFTKMDYTPIQKLIERGIDVVDEAEGATVVKSMGRESRKMYNKFTTNYGVFAYEAGAKAETMKETVGTTLNILLHNKDQDEVLEMLNAYKKLGSKVDKEVMEGLMMLSNNAGSVPFSRAGMQTMEYIKRLQDAIPDIPALAKKYGDDVPGFIEHLTKTTDGLIDDMFPSVNDMLTAKKAVKEALKAGEEPSKRMKYLAKRLDIVPDHIKAANSLNNALVKNKLYQGLTGYFANAHMGWRYSYGVRNLQTDSMIIAHDLGTNAAMEAIKSSSKGLIPPKLGQGIVDAQMLKHEEKQRKLLGGMVSTKLGKGVGAGGVEGKAFGYVIGQNVEKLGSGAVLNYVIETQLMQGLRNGGLVNPAKILPGMPEGTKNALIRAVLENYGDVKGSKKAFEKIMSEGQRELWRTKELRPKFEDTLRRCGMLDAFQNVRATAKTAQEFEQETKKLWDVMEAQAEMARYEPSHVAANEAGDWLNHNFGYAVKEGIEKEEDAMDFTAMVQARGEVRSAHNHMESQVRYTLQNLESKTFGQTPYAQDYVKKNAQLQKVLDEGNDALRAIAKNTIDAIKAYKKGEITAEDIWRMSAEIPVYRPAEAAKAAKEGQKASAVYTKTRSIAEFYGDKVQDPSIMSDSELIGRLWNWTKKTQAHGWADYTAGHVGQTEKYLDEWATALGVNLDDVIFGRAEGVEAVGQEVVIRLQRALKNVESWDEWGGWFSAHADEFTEAAEGVGDLTKVSSTVGKADVGKAVKEGLEEIGKSPVKERLGKRPVPPYVEGSRPTRAREMYENLNGGLRTAIGHYISTTKKAWGEVEEVVNLSPEEMAKMDEYWEMLGKATDQNRIRALSTADAQRDFIFHDYKKTYTDLFAGWGLMYHYWPSRTYAKFISRAADSPGKLAAYSKYRETQEKLHADQPEWFRYMTPVKGLPGMGTDPLYFNLEAALNPLNGLTGVDFEDPRRRVDALSSIIDDAGKLGFNVSVPLQWANAARLAAKGEDDAARRWAGRLLPQTKQIKAAASLMGIDKYMPDVSFAPGVKFGELDPFVNVLSGGIDPYEEGRVGKVMASQIMNGDITPERGIEAMVNRDENYDIAVRKAIRRRATADMASYFLGVAYKGRTEDDVEIEKYYNEYHTMLSRREHMSPADWKKSMEELREKYQFADALSLAKKGGVERDASYSYQILQRIPPGMSDDIMKDAGLSYNTIQRFYDGKGTFEGFSKAEQERWMSTIRDLGVMLEIPEGTVREEWRLAKDMNAQIYTATKDLYGEDVWDKVSVFFELLDEDKDAAYAFKDTHPELQEALNMRAEAIATNEFLFKHYGSFDKLESYWEGWVKNKLQKRFGNTSKMWSDYYGLKMAVEEGLATRSELNQFKDEHPFLFGDYQEYKKELEKEADKQFSRLAKELPEGRGITYREDYDPDDASAMQQQFMQTLAPEQMPSIEGLTQVVRNPIVVDAILRSVETGQPLGKQVQSQLEYVTRTNGMTIEQVMQYASFALARRGR